MKKYILKQIMACGFLQGMLMVWIYPLCMFYPSAIKIELAVSPSETTDALINQIVYIFFIIILICLIDMIFIFNMKSKENIKAVIINFCSGFIIGIIFMIAIFVIITPHDIGLELGRYIPRYTYPFLSTEFIPLQYGPTLINDLTFFFIGLLYNIVVILFLIKVKDKLIKCKNINVILLVLIAIFTALCVSKYIIEINKRDIPKKSATFDTEDYNRGRYYSE